MKWTKPCAVAVMAFLFFTATAAAATDPALISQAKRAADSGLRYLRANQGEDGSWSGSVGITALALRAFLENRRPDWPALLSAHPRRRFAVVVRDNSTGIPADRIRRFDLAAVAARFTRPLAIRPVDHRRYGVFGFLLTETSADTAAELDAILHDDLRTYVTV